MARQGTSRLPRLSLLDRLSLEDGPPEGARAQQVVTALATGSFELVCRYCGLHERITVRAGESPYRTAEEQGWEFAETAQGEKLVCPKCARTHEDKIHYRNLAQQYKDSLKRDLEWLLNTRRTLDSRIGDFAQVSSSIYAYGLPDITSIDIASENQQRQLVEMMKETLRLFERRLKNVNIQYQPVAGGSRSLHFIITGVLLIDPAPEDIRIETILDSSSTKYEVKR